MKKVSIFNEVIGPIMRGPSSSHTAASYHLGKIIRDLLEGDPKQVIIRFAKNGSYAEVYHQQGSDLGFATGIMGKEIISEGFNKALQNAENSEIDIQFKVKEFKEKVHPYSPRDEESLKSLFSGLSAEMIVKSNFASNVDEYGAGLHRYLWNTLRPAPM